MPRQLFEMLVEASDRYETAVSIDNAAVADIYCMRGGIDLVLTAGPLASEIARGAGQPEHGFAGREELIAALPGLLRRGDTVLVKASRSMRFEEITAALEALRPR